MDKNNCVFRKQRIDINGNGIVDEYHKAIQQVLSYIKGVKDQKDDAPDSLSMLRRFINELGLNFEVNTSKDNRSSWESIPIEINQITV